MPETISYNNPGLKGETTLTAYLRNSVTGVLVNTGGGGGDALTESPSNSGRFTMTLTESRTGLGQLVADIDDGSGNTAYAWLEEGSTIMTETDSGFLDGNVSELAAVPAATAGLRTMLKYMFMWFRNKSIQNTTERKLYADDNTTVVATESTVDAASVFTKGKGA